VSLRGSVVGAGFSLEEHGAQAAVERAGPTAFYSPRTEAGDAWEPGALVLVVLLLSSFGLVQLYSASTFMAQTDGLPAHFYALRQLVGMIPGVAICFILSRLDYHRWEALAWPALGAVVLLLVLIVLPGTEAIAPRINGARRWIHAGIVIQPSEFAKFALIVWTAALAVKKQDRLHSLRRGLLPFLIVWSAVLVPVMLQPDFSTVFLLALLGSLILFAGGARIAHFIVLCLVAAPLAWQQVAGASYRLQRVSVYLDPSADPARFYQSYQSLIAIGSGGLTGVGYGGGQQKFGFLPEPHNDFLFAMIAEEWGFVGVLFTIALFAGFAAAGFRIAARAPDLFGYLLGVGMTSLITVSALLHMAVGLALVPTTGVILPFMSYGRSSLIVCFAALGVLLSISRMAQKGAAR
jgi:cell division protein FtsW